MFVLTQSLAPAIAEPAMRRALLLLLLVALALAWQAPAWLLGRDLAERSGGLVELRNSAGTIWHGEADAIVRGNVAGARDIFLGRVAWRAERFDWQRRAVIVEVTQTPGGARLTTIGVGRDRVDVAGSARIPAAIAGRVRLLAGWTFAGDIVLDTDTLAWTGGAGSGAATAQWHNASVVPPDLPGGFALGDVTAQIAIDPGGVTIAARNTGGDVEITADAASRSGRISLLLQPRASPGGMSPAQAAWLQSHTMGRTPRGYTIDAGWPGR